MIKKCAQWVWSFISCWNCGQFGRRTDVLVERPTDGLHDGYMLCSKCASKSVKKLQKELYLTIK